MEYIYFVLQPPICKCFLINSANCQAGVACPFLQFPIPSTYRSSILVLKIFPRFVCANLIELSLQRRLDLIASICGQVISQNIVINSRQPASN